MDLRELIEAGTAKAGEQKELARLIHINPNDLTNAKAGRRGIPASSCFMLAEYLGIDPARVIAASALVTEKNEERRKVFYPFVMGRAAMILAWSVLTGITALPLESHAAQRIMSFASSILHIMSNRRLLQIKAAFYRCFMIRAFSYDS